mmetsp:Transcript_5502/g.8752  ORF Transcript_5502/g.8752 Transcript_5502/m.8752 type:complete len:489 (+) Transcript_5502:256-1722(+)
MAVHGLKGAVDQVSTRPLLVGKGVDSLFPLRALDALDVSKHGLLLNESSAQAVGIQSGQVESSKSDELPCEAQLSKILAEGVHLLVGHAASVPVEGRRKVVGQVRLLSRAVDTLHTSCEALGILKDWLGGLSPHDVSVRSEVAHPVDAGVDARLKSEVSLTGTGKLPIPEGLLSTQKLTSKAASVLVGDSRELSVLLGPLVQLPLLSAVLLELVEHGLVVGDNPVVLLPGIHLIRALGIAVRPSRLVGGALDEHVVARILVGLDKLGSFGVGTGNDDSLSAHDVALQTGSHEAVDVLAGGHQNLSSHVAALLGSVPLILEVDSSSTSVNHGLGQAHDSGHATVAGVSVSNDRAKVVGGVLEASRLPLSLELLAVVELLGAEKTVDVLGDSVEGVVSKVRAGLVDRRVVGAGLPSRHIDGLCELDHLGQLGNVEAPEGGGAASLLTQVPDELEELASGEGGGRAGPLHRSSEAGDVLSGVVTESALETV